MRPEDMDLAPPEGDPRRCARHPWVKTSDPFGMFDAPCGECEHEIDMEQSAEQDAERAQVERCAECGREGVENRGLCDECDELAARLDALVREGMEETERRIARLSSDCRRWTPPHPEAGDWRGLR